MRQAIAYAIDINTIVKTILGGFAKPVGIWQSPFSFGYEDYPPYPFDPNKAKQALQASGVASPKLVYDVVGSDTQAKEMASAVKDMHYVPGASNVGREPVFTYIIIPFNLPADPAARKRITDACTLADFPQAYR